jgi:hypothetical protein
MKFERVITVSRRDKDEKGIDVTRHLTGEERVSLLEDIRRDMAKVTHHEYPSRLRRLLEISQR